MNTSAATSPHTNVYIDGFNLYYRCLKGTPYRWLDLEKMCRLLLPGHHIRSINYYTARITPPPQDKVARQDVYLRALGTLPLVSIAYGTYLSHRVTRRLANPPPSGSAYVEVIDIEEKGSDVNLATHLVWDACRNNYDVAVVVSNDSDLAEPIRVVRRELGKSIGILNPLKGNRPANPQLIRHATFVKRIRAGVLRLSQLPPTLSDRGGSFHKPPEW